MRSIRIDEVIVARNDANEAEPLPDGLAKEVYNEPIIVRGDMVLVDGLRRLLWHREQGNETVPVIVVSTFLEAMEAIRPQNEGRKPNPKRTWNFHSVLRDYSLAWKGERARKGGYGWEKGPDGTWVRSAKFQGRTLANSTRIQYEQALNINAHQYQCSVYLYRLAESGDPRAKALVERVERGEITIVRAVKNYRRPGNLTGNVTKVDEQRRILDRGVSELHAQVSILQKLGYPVVVSSEELAEAIAGMTSARKELNSMIISLRKIFKERETNG